MREDRCERIIGETRVGWQVGFDIVCEGDWYESRQVRDRDRRVKIDRV